MPSKIEQFIVQIDQAMERRISSPEYSPRQAEILRILKSEVIKTISRKERRYLEDFVFNYKEFKEVFAEIKVKNMQILEEVGIDNFNQFMNFVEGDNDFQKMELVESAGELEIFGFKLKLVLPLGVTRRKEAHYLRIAKRINEYEVLRPYFNDKVELVTFDDSRLEFVVERDGKKVKYCANYEKVLRVDKDLSVEAKRNLTDKRIEFRRMKIAHVDPERLKRVESELQGMELDVDMDRRILFDEILQTSVEELNFSLSYGWIYLERDAAADKPALTKILYSRGNLKDRFAELNDFALRVSEIHEYKDGRKVEFWFRGDGIKSHKIAGNLTELYDSKGEKILAVSSLKSEGEGAERKMVSADGKEYIGDFVSEKNMDAQMTEDSYLDKFRKIVRTSEQYFVFEDLFLEDMNAYSFDLLKRLRQYGKEVTGIDYLAERFYGKHGIKVETEGFSLAGRCKLVVLAAVEKALYRLDSLIDVYPPGLIKAYLHEIVFTSKLKKKMSGFTQKYAFLPDLTKIFLVLPFNDHAFQHEFFHCMDSIGTLSDDNHQWGLDVYGEDYEKYYFDSGTGEYSDDELLHERESGFPSTYAFKGIDEDQAEVAGRLLTGDSVLMGAMKEEPVLLKKVQLIKRRFFEISNGRMDRQFWQDLEDGVKINRSYWRRREKERPSGGQRMRDRNGMENIGF